MFQTFSWLLEQSSDEGHIHQVTWEITNLVDNMSDVQKSYENKENHLPHLIMVSVYLIV